jgi:hypothetical protein
MFFSNNQSNEHAFYENKRQILMTALSPQGKFGQSTGRLQQILGTSSTKCTAGPPRPIKARLVTNEENSVEDKSAKSN